MTIAARISATTLIAVAVLAGTACSGKSSFTDKNGNVTTVDPGSHTITYKDKTGTHTVANSVDVHKLGVPLYPGATVASGGGYHVGQATHGGDIAMLTASASFDDVVAWYGQHLPKGAVKQGVLKTPIGGAASFTFVNAPDKSTRAVMIAGNDKKTTITVTAGAPGSSH